MLVATSATLSTSSESAPPLIDFDWTSVVIFGFFLVMMAVLNRFLFQPYLRMRERRTERIDGSRASAKESGERADKMLTDYEDQLGRARQRGADERGRLRTDAATREREVLGKARQEAQGVLDAARQKIATDTAVARTRLDAEANVLAQQVAKKVLGREVRG